MFLKKEREVIILMDRHLAGIEKWLETASGAVESYLRDDITAAEALALKISEIKTADDDIQFSIWESLCNGAYLPMIRKNLLIIVKSVGRIAEHAKTCCDRLILTRPDIPEKMKVHFLQLTEAAFHSIHPIKEGVIRYMKGGDLIDFVKAGSKDFWRLETRMNALECELTRQIYSAPLDSWQKTQLIFCMESLVRVSAQAVETANELQRIFIELIP